MSIHEPIPPVLCLLLFCSRIRQITQQSLVTQEAAMSHLTGLRGNWISFSEHSIIIGKAGLNLFHNEACVRVAATLAFR